MKHNYLKHLFTALLLLCATVATAHDFEVGGIYYNILSEEDKTVEVTYKGTSYSEYSNEYTGSVVIPGTVTKSEMITTVLGTFNDWTSTNKGSSGTTSQTSYTLNVKAGNILKFDWSVSSESNYDWLTITLDGTQIVRKSGTLSGSYEKTFTTAGTHTLVVKYSKDGSVDNGNDEGKIYNITLSVASGSANEVVYSVTSIGESAFSGCSGLTSVVIPNSVTSIGYRAFYECSNLASIEFPNSVTSIGINAFYSTLWHNNLPAGVVYAGKVLYKCNEENTHIEIKGGTTQIYDDAFKSCYSLVSIEIPNSVTSIGVSAFSNCSGLTSVVIPNSVTSIGSYAFYYCTNLANVVIGDGVTTIGSSAFVKCTSLTTVEIPNGVTRIYDCTFMDCSKLRTVILPKYLTSIGYFAFSGCNNLRVAINPSNYTLYPGSDSSGNMSSGVTVVENVNLVGDFYFSGDNMVYYKGNAIELSLPDKYIDGSYGISGYAFWGSTNMTNVVIPANVDNIANWAFAGCTALTSITSLIPAENLFTITNVFNSVDKNACTLYVPYGAKETYASTAGWNEFSNIVELEKPITEVTVTINQYGNATYCSPYALDFSEVEGLKAYAATGYKSNSQVVTLTRVQTAEAGVGLFLKGEPGEYVVPVIESTDEHSLNLLVGTLEQTTVNSTDGAMSNYKFTITEGDEAPMFYPFEDNTTLSAGKAYLQIPTAWLPVTAQKSLSIRFDDGETTDIDELKGESGEVKTIYDLQGRVVENPTNGMYIIDEKKVFINK